jgi:hypothetical protein
MTDANNCYKILNIDIPPLKEGLIFPDVDPRLLLDSMPQARMNTSTYLNPDLISFLANNNIKLADFFYTSNTVTLPHQSGPYYTAFTDGNYSSNGQVKLATLEWNFSNTKVNHIFLDSANSEPYYDVTTDDTKWSNCTTIIANVTPDDRPILFNCQAISVDNKGINQKGIYGQDVFRQRKLSLVFIAAEIGDPNPDNFGPEQLTFESISEKLKDYVVE